MFNNLFKLAEGQELRYEKKFIIPLSDLSRAQSLIKLHPACFKKSFPKRQINNIYFDSFNLKNYQDNLMGMGQRLKARIRWYGNDFKNAANPQLEIKLKNNGCGKKLIYPLSDFAVDKNIGKQLQALFSKAYLPGALKYYLAQLKVTSLNSYERQYYCSSDKRFRLTLDNKLRFYNTQGKLLNSEENYILELKYGHQNDEDGRRVSSDFPYLISKYSKYVTGIETSAIR